MFDLEKMKDAMRQMIEAIGEDPQREGLINTPDRVARMYLEIFSGLKEEPQEYLKTIFTSDYDEPILVKDIHFYSMCEHHFLPFFGKVHIAYLPQNGIVTGLSKLVRVVNSISKRPQIQENMTSQIADVIMDCLNPMGVAVVVEAEHMCMSMRGVKKPGTKTITTVFRGVFNDDGEKRNQILALIEK